MYHGACRVSEEYIRAVHVGALNPTGSRLCRRELRLRRLRLPLLGGGVRRARLDRAAALPDDAAHHGRLAMTQGHCLLRAANTCSYSPFLSAQRRALARLATISPLAGIGSPSICTTSAT